MTKTVGLALVTLTLGAAVVGVRTSDTSRASAETHDVRSAAGDLAGQTRTLLSDGRWLILGGKGPQGALAAASIWDHATSETTALAGGLATARAWHTATVLPDGTVLVLGGIGSDGRTVGAPERFDSATGLAEIVLTAGPIARSFHSTTLLIDGRILIAGGLSADGEPTSSVELMDWRTGAIEPFSASLSTPRFGQTATLLSNGVVLLSAGFNRDGTPIQGGELVDVETGLTTAVDVAPLLPGVGPATLEGTVPRPDAAGVASDAVVGLRFSRPLDVQSITADTVTLTGPEGTVAARVVPAEGGMLVFMSPGAPLRPGASYQVGVHGVRDADGLPAVPTAFGFSTTGTAGDADQARPPETTPRRGPAAAGPSPERDEREEEADEDDDEWIPTQGDIERGWRSGRGTSPWQRMPPLRTRRGVTALAGQVLRLNGRPLAGVRLEINGRTARTDAYGRFLLAGLPRGHAELLVDGGPRHGLFEIGIDIVKGKTTVLPYTIWLPKIDRANAVTIPSPTTEEVVITTKRIPGLELRIPPNTVIRDHEGRIVRRLSITAIPVDQPPFPLPEGVRVPLYFTIQPGGSYVVNDRWEGARLIYPNNVREEPGARFDFWNYDAEDRGWYIYGGGTVTQDGSRVVPDPGVWIYEFSGAMVAGPGFAAGSGPPPGADGGCGTPGGAPPFGAGDDGDGGGGCGGAGLGSDGEPVDLYSGLFVYRRTDLFLPDVIPIVLRRNYRQNDNRSRALCVGTTLPYDMFLAANIPEETYLYVELVLPDGGRIHYVRVPGTGTSLQGAILEHTSSPTIFYKSTVSWTGTDWDLKLRDGTVFKFPDGGGAIRPTQGALKRITDRFGNMVTIDRDANSNATRITSPNGRWIDLEYEAVDPQAIPIVYRVFRATDNIGRQVNYTYDINNRLIQVQDANSPPGITTYTYDDTVPADAMRRTRMLTIRLPQQNASCPSPCAQPPFLTNAYWDQSPKTGMISDQTLVDGAHYHFDYQFSAPPSAKVTQTDVIYPGVNPPTRRVTFNDATPSTADSIPAGYILSDTRGLNTPNTRQVSYTRSPSSNTGSNLIWQITEPLPGSTRTTQFDYYPDGSLQRITRLAGTAGALATTFAYEPKFFQLASIQDPLGHQTTFQYDPNDPKAVLQSATDASGRRIKVTFNGAGQLISFSQPFLATYPSPVLHTTTFAYEAGELVRVTDPDGNVTTRFLDAAGRVRSIRDALGRVTRYDYDKLNHLTLVTDPNNGITTFLYDRDGNLFFAKDARQQVTNHKATVYVHDGLGRLKTRYDPLSRPPEQFDYEPRGYLKFYQDRRGKKADFEYDGLGRRQCAGFGRISDSQTDCTVAGSHERAIQYTYDAGSRLTQIVDSVAGTNTASFDDADHLTSESTPPRGSVSYTFDKDLRQTMTVAGQPPLCYEYDEADRLKMIRQGGCAAQPTVTITFDDAGRRNVVTLPNGVTETFGYNPRSLISSIQYKKPDASVLGGLTYSYNPIGNRTAMGGTFAETGLPTAVTSASYDDANQLLQWVTASGTTDFTHDANGNVQTTQTGAATDTYNWDARNQLTSIVDQASTVKGSFQYDAAGRRSQKTVGSATTQYLYDLLNPVQELSGGGTPTVAANILTGLRLDESFARTVVSPNTRTSFLSNALGSTIRLADDSAVIATTYKYEPFGKVTVGGSNPSDTNTFTFTGRESDGTGQYYYRARYYSPIWQRFLSEDPLSMRRLLLEGGRSFGRPAMARTRPVSGLMRFAPWPWLYHYAGNNPTNFTDPTGLDVYCAYLCPCFGFECACILIENDCITGIEWPRFIPGPPLGLRVFSCEEFEPDPCVGGPENCS